MNTVQLIGRATDKATLAYSHDGSQLFATVRISVRGDRFTVRITDSTVTNDEAARAAPEHAEYRITPGQRVAITGQLVQEQWTDDDGRARVLVQATTLDYLS